MVFCLILGDEDGGDQARAAVDGEPGGELGDEHVLGHGQVEAQALLQLRGVLQVVDVHDAGADDGLAVHRFLEQLHHAVHRHPVGAHLLKQPQLAVDHGHHRADVEEARHLGGNRTDASSHGEVF